MGGGGDGWVEDKDNSYPWKWQIGKKPKHTAERTASKYRYAIVSPELPCLVLRGKKKKKELNPGKEIYHRGHLSIR